jgi:hypothetical protein
MSEMPRRVCHRKELSCQIRVRRTSRMPQSDALSNGGGKGGGGQNREEEEGEEEEEEEERQECAICH